MDRLHDFGGIAAATVAPLLGAVGWVGAARARVPAERACASIEATRVALSSRR